MIDRERPDVVCLQEVFEEDFKVFVKKFGMKGVFASTVFIDKPGQPGFEKRGIFGIAIMGKLSGKFGSEYYFKRKNRELPKYSGKPNAGNRALVWQKIDERPTIASTHFTWSKNGQTTEKQRIELKALIGLLVNKVNPDVLCGDFNAPRGQEIWSAISGKLTDNIPPETKTTLDPVLHYSHGAMLVVDGFFTRPNSKFTVKSLRLIGGISDHLAVSAIMQKYT